MLTLEGVFDGGSFVLYDHVLFTKGSENQN